MKDVFHKLVNAGIFPDTSIELIDEIRAINSIKIQGALLVWVAGITTMYFMPAHWMFIFSLISVHLIAVLAVLVLNSRKEYALAKNIFIIDPAILILCLSGYFGLEANFQYMALICFLAFLFLFKRRPSNNLLVFSSYMFFTVIGTLILFLFDIELTQLSNEEVTSLRVASYSLSTGLTIMMGVVLYESSSKRNAKTEETLMESARDANILQTISDNMEEAIFKSSVLHGFVYVNEAFARMFGYESKETMLSTQPINLYNSKVERDLLLARVSRQGKVSNVLMSYRREDGSSFWGRLSVSLISEKGGDFLVGTITDVTIQQEQNEQLQENEQQLRNAQQLAKLGNWRVFPSDKRVEWSGECAHIHGFLATDYQDSFNIWLQGFEDISHIEIEQGIKRSKQMNDAFEFGSWYTIPGGAKKFLYYICGIEGEGDDERWFGTVQDRTELKNQELELISTQEFYQNILDNIPVESILIDENLKYHYISRNAIKDAELREWMIGKTNKDYSDYRKLKEDFTQVRDEMVAKAMQGDLTIRWEENMKTGDGRDTYHIRNLVPITLIQDQKPKKFLIGYSFDINDIKRAQFRFEDRNEELNQLNKELDRFVYSISHDLRAPIASVLGLNSLAEDTADREELDTVLAMQREALDRLDLYIRDVIDYSRNKRMAVQSEDVCLRKIVDDCMADLVYQTNYNKIDYFIEIEEQTCIQSDKLRIKIIVNNLLSNAIKYADSAKDNSFISIRAEWKEKGVTLIIEDNGIGIKEDYKDKIWDIFFRGTSTIPGSGLGLYILKESVKNLNGEIDFISKEGEGTTFKIFIPEQTV